MTLAAADPLTALADIARQLGAEDLAQESGEVARRLADRLFHVALVGQFKRGKSTLLNALIGKPILPTGVLPVTNLITTVRFGGRPRAFVRFADGKEEEIEIGEIVEYVSEERNRGNPRGAALVEVQVDSSLLSSGMCLVDTPGLGSIFRESSLATRRFVPQIDVALMVVGADPPLSADEAALAEEILRETPHFIVVLNKADRLPEGDVQTATAFTRGALEDRLGKPIELFVVSAVEPGTRDWSGLQRRLTTWADEAAVDLVQAARDRAIRRLAGRLQREVEEHRQALRVPLGEGELRLAKTHAIVRDTERSLQDLSFLFASEQQKLSRHLAEVRQRFLAEALPEAERELASAKRGDVFVMARRIAHDRIAEWLQTVEPQAAERYAAATARFSRILLELGGEEVDGQLCARRRFYFSDLAALTSSLPLSPHRLNGSSYLKRLLETNSARVINDLIDRMVESRRSLEGQIANSLQGILSVAQRAAQHAKAAHEAGARQVASEIARLERVESDLAGVSGWRP